MKNVRRRLKKRSRSKNFDELEEAFYGLVLHYNILVDCHNVLKRQHRGLKRTVDSIEFENRSYGLDDKQF